MRLIAALVVVAACSKAAPTAPPQPTPAAGPKRAADYTLDGIRLGAKYASQVMSRDPYRGPCDDDMVGARRAMVYGGQPCRGNAFPDGTTVIFLIAPQEGREPEAFDTPIEAMAWMGGTYFDARGDFPVHPGATPDALSVLGEAQADTTLEDHDVKLVIRRFPGDVRALLYHDVVAGFVLGPMPDSIDDEQWEVVSEMFRRYTPRPSGGSSLSREECRKALDHVATLPGAETDYLSSDRAVDKCLDQLDRAGYDCVMKATTMEAVEACEPK